MPKKGNKRQADDDGNLSLKKLVSDLKTAQKPDKIEKQLTEEEMKAILEPMMALLEQKTEKQKTLSETFHDEMTDLLKGNENSLQKTKEDNALKLARVHKKFAQQNIQREDKNLNNLKQASEAFYQSFDHLYQTSMNHFEELGTPFYKKMG